MMRIISGAHKKRRIRPPKGLKERPTTDRAKEGLFNILQSRSPIEELKVLDLFAGTGSIAYEFCSRDAQEVTAVEKDRELCAFIERNAAEMEMGQLKVVRADVLRFLDRCSDCYDLIFADPPYAEEGFYEGLLERVRPKELLREKGTLILEHDERSAFDTRKGFEQTRCFGNACFSFFVF